MNPSANPQRRPLLRPARSQASIGERQRIEHPPEDDEEDQEVVHSNHLADAFVASVPRHTCGKDVQLIQRASESVRNRRGRAATISGPLILLLPSPGPLATFTQSPKDDTAQFAMRKVSTNDQGLTPVERDSTGSGTETDLTPIPRPRAMFEDLAAQLESGAKRSTNPARARHIRQTSRISVPVEPHRRLHSESMTLEEVAAALNATLAKSSSSSEEVEMILGGVGPCDGDRAPRGHGSCGVEADRRASRRRSKTLAMTSGGNLNQSSGMGMAKVSNSRLATPSCASLAVTGSPDSERLSEACSSDWACFIDGGYVSTSTTPTSEEGGAADKELDGGRLSTIKSLGTNAISGWLQGTASASGRIPSVSSACSSEAAASVTRQLAEELEAWSSSDEEGEGEGDEAGNDVAWRQRGSTNELFSTPSASPALLGLDLWGPSSSSQPVPLHLRTPPSPMTMASTSGVFPSKAVQDAQALARRKRDEARIVGQPAAARSNSTTSLTSVTSSTVTRPSLRRNRPLPPAQSAASIKDLPLPAPPAPRPQDLTVIPTYPSPMPARKVSLHSLATSSRSSSLSSVASSLFSVNNSGPGRHGSVDTASSCAHSSGCGGSSVSATRGLNATVKGMPSRPDRSPLRLHANLPSTSVDDGHHQQRRQPPRRSSAADRRLETTIPDALQRQGSLNLERQRSFSDLASSRGGVTGLGLHRGPLPSPPTVGRRDRDGELPTAPPRPPTVDEATLSRLISARDHCEHRSQRVGQTKTTPLPSLPSSVSLRSSSTSQYSTAFGSSTALAAFVAEAEEQIALTNSNVGSKSQQQHRGGGQRLRERLASTAAGVLCRGDRDRVGGVPPPSALNKKPTTTGKRSWEVSTASLFAESSLFAAGSPAKSRDQRQLAQQQQPQHQREKKDKERTLAWIGAEQQRTAKASHSACSSNPPTSASSAHSSIGRSSGAGSRWMGDVRNLASKSVGDLLSGRMNSAAASSSEVWGHASVSETPLPVAPPTDEYHGRTERSSSSLLGSLSSRVRKTSVGASTALGWSTGAGAGNTEGHPYETNPYGAPTTAGGGRNALGVNIWR